MLNRLNRYSIFVLLYVVILLVVLAPFYRNGHLILGGEGNFFIDFGVSLRKFGFLWHESGTGTFSSSINANFFSVIFFILLQKIGLGVQAINFILVFSLYFLPFFAFMLIGKQLKLVPWVSAMISLFYVVNPFSLWLLANLNQWNLIVFFVLPFFFWVILKYYDDNRKLFFYLGFSSLFVSFANTNPPLIAIIQLSLAISVVAIAYLLNPRSTLWSIAKKYFVVLCSFVLFNLWWLLAWVHFFTSVESGYTKDFALSWLGDRSKFIPVWWKTLNLTMLMPWPLDPGYDYLSRFYNHFFVPIILIIPTVIVLVLWQKKENKQRSLLFLLVVWVIAGFLSKGVYGMLGEIYVFAVKYVPLFSVFKSASEKWGLLSVFLLTLLMVLFFKNSVKEKTHKILLSFLGLYLIFCSLPLLTSNFLPDYNFYNLITGTKKYVDKPEYKDFRRLVNNEKGEFRVFSLPGGYNYQVALDQGDGKHYYTGLDPVLNNIYKPFIAAYNDNQDQRHELYRNISHPNFLNMLGLLNVKKIVINRDLYPWFGFVERENASTLQKIFDEILEGHDSSVLSYYDLGEKYLPRIYIPNIIDLAVNSQKNEVLYLLGRDDNRENQAIYTGEEIKQFDYLIPLTGSRIVVAAQSDEEGNVYRLPIPQSGDYRIYLENESQINNWQIKDKLVSSIDPKSAWIVLGEEHFDQGDSVLSVVKTPSRNLLRSAWLSSAQNKIVAYQEINDWLPGKKYKLDIEIKESHGKLRLLVVEAEEYGNLNKSFYAATKQLNDNVALLNEEVNTQQSRITRVIKSSDYGKKATVMFLKERPDDEAKIEIQKQSVTMLTVPRIVAVKKNNSIDAQKTEVSFRKINPTKYIAEIETKEDAVDLVFSETYDHGWKAKVNGKTIPEKQHLLVNGYANSWVILPQDTQWKKTYQVVIDYQPQKTVYIGLVVSGFVCLASLFLVLFRK